MREGATRATGRRRFLGALLGAGAAPVLVRSSAAAVPVEYTDFVAGTIVELDVEARRLVLESPAGSHSVTFTPMAGFYRDHDAHLSEFRLGDRVIVPGESGVAEFVGVHMSSTYEVLRGVVTGAGNGVVRMGSKIIENPGGNEPLRGWDSVEPREFHELAPGAKAVVVTRFDPETDVYLAQCTGVARG
nr:hypothetical protein [uncultured bacterium]